MTKKGTGDKGRKAAGIRTARGVETAAATGGGGGNGASGGDDDGPGSWIGIYFRTRGWGVCNLVLFKLPLLGTDISKATTTTKMSVSLAPCRS